MTRLSGRSTSDDAELITTWWNNAMRAWACVSGQRRTAPRGPARTPNAPRDPSPLPRLPHGFEEEDAHVGGPQDACGSYKDVDSRQHSSPACIHSGVDSIVTVLVGGDIVLLPFLRSGYSASLEFASHHHSSLLRITNRSDQLSIR